MAGDGLRHMDGNATEEDCQKWQPREILDERADERSSGDTLEKSEIVEASRETLT